MQREIDAAAALLKENKDAAKAQAPVKAESTLHNTPEATVRNRILLRRILMAAAVVFIILGIMNGSMKDVLVKAIKICTECVGLG